MIGKRLYLGKYKMEEYDEAVEWADSNNAIVALFDDYYEVIPIPAPSLDEAKKRKITELKSIRDTKEVEPIQTDKGIFDYDDKSRDRLAIARQALTDNGGGSITWTTADNQRVDMGIADFAAINGAAAVRSNALHVLYNELKEQVNACQTVEEVNSIQWTETL